MLIQPNNGWISVLKTGGARGGSTVEQVLDLAPMVDIVFTLIIFFMLTSPFITQWGVKVDLPRLRSVQPIKSAEVEIRVTADNRIFLSGREVSIKLLKEELLRLAETGRSVTIMGDENSSLGVAFQVWDAARSAKIKDLNIQTRIKEAERD